MWKSVPSIPWYIIWWPTQGFKVRFQAQLTRKPFKFVLHFIYFLLSQIVWHIIRNIFWKWYPFLGLRIWDPIQCFRAIFHELNIPTVETTATITSHKLQTMGDLRNLQNIIQTKGDLINLPKTIQTIGDLITLSNNIPTTPQVLSKHYHAYFHENVQAVSTNDRQQWILKVGKCNNTWSDQKVSKKIMEIFFKMIWRLSISSRRVGSPFLESLM